MSAYFARQYDDRIELLTDGAIYMPDGTLVAFAEKVHHIPGLPIAVTGRGSTIAVAGMAKVIMIHSLANGPEQAIVAASDFMLSAAERGLFGSVHFELFIAAFLKEGPAMFYLNSFGALGNVEFRPFHMTFVDEIGFFAGTSLPADLVDPIVSNEDGLAGRGVELMDHMRRQKGGNPADPTAPEIYGIGGHVDHTVIRADGCVTTRLHSWPDRIGEKVDPFAGDTIIGATARHAPANLADASFTADLAVAAAA